MPSRSSPWSVYDVFTLADGQLFIAAVSDKNWRLLCEVLGRPDLLADPALATNEQRVAVRPQLLQRLGEILRGHRQAELSAKLEAAGLPYAPIARPDQLATDPHLVQSGALVPIQAEDGSATQTMLLPFTLGGRRPGVQRPLPRVGEHTEEVLARLLA